MAAAWGADGRAYWQAVPFWLLSAGWHWQLAASQLFRTFGQNRGDAANATQIRGPGYLTTCTGVGTKSTSNLGRCVSDWTLAAGLQLDTQLPKFED